MMKDWLRPRDAIATLQNGLGISRDEAIQAICRRASRLSPQMIVAVASSMIGESPPSIPRMPDGVTVLPIWPFLWQAPLIRDPRNSLWTTGDTEFYWASIPHDTFTILEIRFKRESLRLFLAGDDGDNDNQLPTPASERSEIVALPLTDRTGAPGAPSSMHIVLAMMRERFARGENSTSITAEASELVRLFEGRHDCAGLRAPTAKTIRNKLAPEFRRLQKSPIMK